MKLQRMPLEDWFEALQYEIDYDIGESAVKYRHVGDLDVDVSAVALRYGHHAGLPALREEIAREYPGRRDDDVLVTAGASEALFTLFSALLSPGDHVVVEHPNYPSLWSIPRGLGADVELFRLRREDAFRPDWDVLTGLLRPETRLVAITSPHNPTGSAISEDELRALVDLTARRGITLLVDETYRHLAFDSRTTAAATLAEHVVSVSTMSKCFGLPGLRIGWSVTGDAALRRQMMTVREHTTITNNVVGEHLALAVLRDAEPYLRRAAALVHRNRDVATRWIGEQPSIEWVPPVAGVVALPWLVGIDEAGSDRLYRRLARDERTFVVPGRCFEMDNRFFRLGFGGTSEEFEEGLRRLGILAGALAGNDVRKTPSATRPSAAR